MFNNTNVLEHVDTICKQHNIEREEVLRALEEAVHKGAEKVAGEGVTFEIDRRSGEIVAFLDGVPYPSDQLGALVGDIGAGTIRSTLMQALTELVVNHTYNECRALLYTLVRGTVNPSNFPGHNSNGGRSGRATIVTLENGCEAILPNSEKIPKDGSRETFHTGQEIYAMVIDVAKNGNKVKTTLSRTHSRFVRLLLEEMIPDIKDGIVEIKETSREPGRRSKIAVTAHDPLIDVTGACIGYRGQLIRAVTDEIKPEKIDIIEWSDQPQRMIALALKPAEVEEVIICDKLGRAIVLVSKEQRSPAIGKQGENVRLATQLVELDISIMLRDELDEKLKQAQAQFESIDGVTEKVAEDLIAEGFFSYADVSLMEIEDLMEIAEISQDEAEAIIDIAFERMQEEEKAEEARKANEREKRAKEGGNRERGSKPDTASDAFLPQDKPSSEA